MKSPFMVMHYLCLCFFLFAPINRLGKYDCFFLSIFVSSPHALTSLSVCVFVMHHLGVVLLFKLFRLDFHYLLSIAVSMPFSVSHSLATFAYPSSLNFQYPFFIYICIFCVFFFFLFVVAAIVC